MIKGYDTSNKIMLSNKEIVCPNNLLNLAYKRKYRIPKSLYSQGPTDKATFNSRMSGLIYEEKRLPKLTISMGDDLYTNIIKFTEFAVKYNIDIIEKEN